MKYLSPLRYPGGKRRLASFIAQVCEMNSVTGHYIEPYAGGAGVALHLLLNNCVREVTVNDFDRSIYAFWYTIKHDSARLIREINKIEVNVESWHEMKAVQHRKNTAPLLELGLSTFFLNRTNVSGALNGGIIGGLEQNGKYKIDCRFNKAELIRRIAAIAEKANRLNVTNLDALELLSRLKRRSSYKSNTIFFFDPPYYLQGESLYLNHYSHNDHLELAKAILGMKNAKWIMTYDDSDEIKKMYRACKGRRTYEIYHTAHRAKKGKELLYSSPTTKLPKIIQVTH